MSERERLELRERTKELAALHETAMLVQDESLSEAELFSHVAALLPRAFLVPEDAECSVEWDGQSFATPGFRRTPWRLRATFGSSLRRVGAVEVAYRSAHPDAADGPFLEEEQDLLDSVARMLEAALGHRRIEEHLGHLVGSGRIRLWELDLATERVTWPGLAASATGPARTWLDLPRAEGFGAIHPDDRERVAALVDAAAAATPGSEEFTTEFRAALPGGAHSWRHLAGRLVRRADGRPARVVGISTDIEEQHALRERVRQSEKMEALGRLAGGVAHDFNNLLSAVQGFAELLSNRLPAGGTDRELVDEITKAAHTGTQLVQQILAFGRRQDLVPQEIDLRVAVADMNGMLSRLLGDRFEVRCEFAPDAPLAVADPTQLQQVILNLCVNARDAMPDGGTLTLRVRRRLSGAPKADGSTEGQRDWAAVEVQDTGTGITPEVQERMFEPFFTTKAPGEGTGLGLATVHGIVTQSGGFLEVESELGRGSLFRAHFPVPRGPPAGG